MHLYVMTARLKRAKQTIGALGVHPDPETARQAVYASVLGWLTEHQPNAIERSMELTAAPISDDELITILVQIALARPELLERAAALCQIGQGQTPA